MNPGIIILMFAAVVVLNVLQRRFIVRQAVEQFIKPYLLNKKLVFERVEKMGLFDFGDFPKEKIEFAPYRKSRNIVLEAFVYVHALTSDNRAIRFTARITSRFMTVTKVDYYGKLI